jgi:competence protein ComFC
MGTFAPPAAAAYLLDLALPPACAGCGAEGEALCRRCSRTLGKRLGLPPGVPIGLPAALPAHLAQLEWCAPFAGVVRTALHHLKYSGEKRLAVPLAAAMAARWREAGVGGELLVPVPVHASRSRQRGYDQAVLLAESVSRALEMPWRPVLTRSRHTRPQFDLGRKARLANVAGAFEIAGPAGTSAIEGSWIVLVDDVVTTGATLTACAGALYGSGAAAVSALTVARER